MKTLFTRALGATIFIGGLCASHLALAHATLERQEAAVGSSYKGVMRVPHGCAGSATIRVRIRIPEGVVGVKPMHKPGWTLETTKGKYE